MPRFTFILVPLALVLLGGLVAAAEGPDVLAALRAGNLVKALEELDQGAKVDSATERIEAARMLAALAAKASGRPREKAYEHALKLLDGNYAEGLHPARDEQILLSGRALADLLSARKPEPRSAVQQRYIAALEALREVHERRGAQRDLLAVDLELIPPLIDSLRLPDAERRCKEWLDHPLAATHRQQLRGYLGLTLLQRGREGPALPYLVDYIAVHPEDPEYVLPIAKKLPSKMGAELYKFLLPVISRPPAKGKQTAWRSCLVAFYEALGKCSPRKEPLRSYLKRNEVRRNLPTMWGNRTWDPGYRTWRPDNYVRSKTGSGKHGIRAVLPSSFGWKRISRPPRELARWRNHTVCFQRGNGNATLVIYWFGPDLHYWYGTTPAKRGMTGKGARGHSRSAIASIVSEIAYGREAKARGVRFKTTRPLKVGLGVRGVTRKAWRVEDWHYDESFFSVGQVTIEVLLKVKSSEVELIEPELRWLFRNITDF